MAIRQVRIESKGAGWRVAALGGQQVNGCTSPGLPGQALRIWEEGLTPTPAGNTCFPNEVIAALGDEAACAETGASEEGGGRSAGLCLIGPRQNRWHECPGCTRDGESPEAALKRLLEQAERKNGSVLSWEQVHERYGLDWRNFRDVLFGALLRAKMRISLGG